MVAITQRTTHNLTMYRASKEGEPAYSFLQNAWDSYSSEVLAEPAKNPRIVERAFRLNGNESVTVDRNSIAFTIFSEALRLRIPISPEERKYIIKGNKSTIIRLCYEIGICPPETIHVDRHKDKGIIVSTRELPLANLLFECRLLSNRSQKDVGDYIFNKEPVNGEVLPAKASRISFFEQGLRYSPARRNSISDLISYTPTDEQLERFAEIYKEELCIILRTQGVLKDGTPEPDKEKLLEILREYAIEQRYQRFRQLHPIGEATLADFFSSLRHSLGLNQDQMAELFNPETVGKSTLASIELGKKPPTSEMLNAFLTLELPNGKTVHDQIETYIAQIQSVSPNQILQEIEGILHNHQGVITTPEDRKLIAGLESLVHSHRSKGESSKKPTVTPLEFLTALYEKSYVRGDFETTEAAIATIPKRCSSFAGRLTANTAAATLSR